MQSRRSTLEWGVGLRIFYTKDLHSSNAGMDAYSADLGACILFNRNDPPERRRVYAPFRSAVEEAPQRTGKRPHQRASGGPYASQPHRQAVREGLD